jgi:hypothetical protein
MSVGEDVDGRSDGDGDLITAAGAASPTAISVRRRPQIGRRKLRRNDRRAVTRQYTAPDVLIVGAVMPMASTCSNV